MGRWSLLLMIVLATCADLPRDAEGTSEQVARTQVIRVGATEGAVGAGEARALVSALEQATGARVQVTRGEAEPLLQALERGELDVALAWLDAKTPWAKRVAPAPALASRGEVELRAMLRNGENRWTMLVERASRDVAGTGAGQ